MPEGNWATVLDKFSINIIYLAQVIAFIATQPMYLGGEPDGSRKTSGCRGSPSRFPVTPQTSHSKPQTHPLNTRSLGAPPYPDSRIAFQSLA